MQGKNLQKQLSKVIGRQFSCLDISPLYLEIGFTSPIVHDSGILPLSQIKLNSLR
jgi:hypothetical protein